MKIKYRFDKAKRPTSLIAILVLTIGLALFVLKQGLNNSTKLASFKQDRLMTQLLPDSASSFSPSPMGPDRLDAGLPPAQTKSKLELQQPATILKSHLIKDVPFTSQAPRAIWDEVHKETCEEAASLMVARWAKGEPSSKLDPDNVEAEFKKLIEWQNQRFGYYQDTTAQETAQILKEFYGLKNVAVRDNPSLSEIKRSISQDSLIIVPAAGRELGNPYFTQPGPIYHMLVVVGYNQDGFTTNDPGTKRGQGMRYSFESIMNAIHDWPGNPDEILNSPRRVIVVQANV